MQTSEDPDSPPLVTVLQLAVVTGDPAAAAMPRNVSRRTAATARNSRVWGIRAASHPSALAPPDDSAGGRRRHIGGGSNGGGERGGAADSDSGDDAALIGADVAVSAGLRAGGAAGRGGRGGGRGGRGRKGTREHGAKAEGQKQDEETSVGADAAGEPVVTTFVIDLLMLQVRRTRMFAAMP